MHYVVYYAIASGMAVGISMQRQRTFHNFLKSFSLPSSPLAPPWLRPAAASPVMSYSWPVTLSPSSLSSVLYPGVLHLCGTLLHLNIVAVVRG